MSTPSVEYIADAAVDATLDRALRDLLCDCFTGPGGEVFRDRRYYHEPPQHRWFIRAAPGKILAHVAVHEKVVVFGGHEHRIGGIAEVCVRPEQRGHGYVKVLLKSVHEWLRAHGFEYAILFGKPPVYASSGYVEAPNLVKDEVEATGKLCRQRAAGAMVAVLTGQAWPTGEVFLPGRVF